MKYIKPEVISLKSNKEYNEKWLQARIEEDPSILELGTELEMRQSEKKMVGGGRLDTILFDRENNIRYEVEIQLGKTDESHIIRTIEYWDIERRRLPQYEHCAVIIAEDITSRFLNVISLFNGFIPIIAIQVKAVKIGDTISLFFTKVIDKLNIELLEEDIVSEAVDRNYWEKKVGKTSMQLVDDVYKTFAEQIGDYNLKYLKHYIGLEKDSMANNFISINPSKKSVAINIKLESTTDIDTLLEQSDLEILSYDRHWGAYRIKIPQIGKVNSSDLDMIKTLIAQAKADRMG